MATITHKRIHRNRIQFTMSRQLHEAHQANQELAEKLNVVIDFSRDFEKWFGVQIDQTAKLLKQLQDDAPELNTHPVANDDNAATHQSEAPNGNNHDAD